MPKGDEALTPWSSHLHLQAQTALTMLATHLCGGANVSEYRSTSGAPDKECSTKHLPCCWVFPQVSCCLFLLPDAVLSVAEQGERWDRSVLSSPEDNSPVEMATSWSGAFRSKINQHCFGLNFIQWGGNLLRQRMVQVLAASFVQKCWSVWRSWWDSLKIPSGALSFSLPLPGKTLTQPWFWGYYFSAFFFISKPTLSGIFFQALQHAFLPCWTQLHFDRCIFHRKLMYCFPKAILVCKLHCSLPSCTLFQPAKRI